MRSTETVLSEEPGYFRSFVIILTKLSSSLSKSQNSLADSGKLFKSSRDPTPLNQTKPEY